jgi:hypothetical protein
MQEGSALQRAACAVVVHPSFFAAATARVVMFIRRMRAAILAAQSTSGKTMNGTAE